MKLIAAVVSSLVVVSLVGCSKPSPEEQKKNEEAFAAAIASTLSAATTPSGGAAAAAAPGSGATQALMGNCTDKTAGYCQEYLGFVPTMAEDMCKRGGSGVLTKGAVPCSRAGLTGTCESRGPDQSEIRYSYKADYETFAQSAESSKTTCSIVSGVWIPAPPPAATAAAPAKGAAAKPKKK